MSRDTDDSDTGGDRTQLPGRDDILAYLRDHPGPVSVSELARAFKVKGKDRTALRIALREATQEGLIQADARRKFSSRETLPSVTVLEITGPDPDGELLARPVRWPDDKPVPKIYVAPARGAVDALAIGERILAQLTADEDGGYDAKVLRRLGRARTEIIGVFTRERNRTVIQPTDRRAKYSYGVQARHAHGAEAGELVRARVLAERSGTLRMAEVTERLGGIKDPGAIGLIALHSNDIPIEFPAAALDEANAARAATPAGREDLRTTPLVTIDDEDARDFDDAVFAEPDDAPDNKGGFRLIVAIADVAHYVAPGGALDRAAARRGNSVYLPDRVVPMLPEALSNDLCSLRPLEDRAVLACHMRIDSSGNLMDHRFTRALIRSAARLTYCIAQAAFEAGNISLLPDGLSLACIENLYAAYNALAKARLRRGTLELELPEHKVTIENGKVTHIGTRTRLNSHRLIEEFMIAANVAAAEALEARRAPCMYRVHPTPDAGKLEALRDFLDTFGLSLPRGQVTRAAAFAPILARASEGASAEVIHEAILRSQSQAFYGTKNAGHFGLALRRYAHFTSPIRRYADLVVHRALIGAYDLGAGGIGRDAAPETEALSDSLSAAERRAVSAEREAMDRYMALYLSERTGTHMKGRITGVTRFGLFVRLAGLGADGLVPIGSLGDERFHHDERHHCLEGGRSGKGYTLGDDVEVEIREADAVTGSLTLTVTHHWPLKRAKRAGGRPRPASPRHKGSKGKGGKSKAAKSKRKTRQGRKKPKARP